MESIQPDTSMPSEEAPRTSKAELLTLQLPLGPNQIREQARRFEEFLTRASSAVESQGTTINFKVTITSHASEDILQAILPQAAISTTANIDSAAGAGHPTDTPDPMTDAPALPSADSEGEALATEVTPIYPTQPTETDAEGNGGVSQESPVTTSPPPQCKICMDDLTPESTIMINCGCIYCGTCLNSHIMHGLSSRANYPARCCGAEGIDIGDTQPYLTFEVILRWSEVEAEYKERMPMYCQNKECSAHIPEGRLGVERKFIECNSCHTDTCKECKQWRFDHCGEDLEICQEDIVSKEDRELANSEKWKQCPGCKNLVERSEGCNNMMCECDTEFCYDCGVEFSPDHRCGCETIPDPDGYHHRRGEMPAGLADDVNPRDTMTEGDFVMMLGNALVRAHRDGHGPFTNAVDGGNWLWEEEEEILWDRLGEQEQTLVFQAYERVLREQAAEWDDPARGWGVGEAQAEGHGVGGEAPASVAQDPAAVD